MNLKFKALEVLKKVFTQAAKCLQEKCAVHMRTHACKLLLISKCLNFVLENEVHKSFELVSD